MLLISLFVLIRRWKSPEQYWLPRSEWKITPVGERRRHSAIRSASHTSTAVMRSDIDQPTTRRLYRSMTVARYSQPSSLHK